METRHGTKYRQLHIEDYLHVMRHFLITGDDAVTTN